jgi:hypothetical protein
MRQLSCTPEQTHVWLISYLLDYDGDPPNNISPNRKWCLSLWNATTTKLIILTKFRERSDPGCPASLRLGLILA